MKRTLSLVIVSALFLAAAARAQSTPQTPQQPAKPYNTLDDDPQFKRLSPEQQELVRKMMQSVDKAIAEEKKTGAAPKAAPVILPLPQPPTAQPGCAAGPVKTPKFHLPKALQDAINKQTKQLGKQTGVDIDAGAPAQAVKDAQKSAPCPPAPAKPANQ